MLENSPACTSNWVSAYHCSQYHICYTCPVLCYQSYQPREQPSIKRSHVKPKENESEDKGKSTNKRKETDWMVADEDDSSSSEDGDSEEGTDEEEGGITEAEESDDEEEACGTGSGEKLKNTAGPRRHVRSVVMKVDGRPDMFWVSYEGECGRGRSAQDLEILVLGGCLCVTCVCIPESPKMQKRLTVCHWLIYFFSADWHFPGLDGAQWKILGCSVLDQNDIWITENIQTCQVSF